MIAIPHIPSFRRPRSNLLRGRWSLVALALLAIHGREAAAEDIQSAGCDRCPQCAPGDSNCGYGQIRIGPRLPSTLFGSPSRDPYSFGNDSPSRRFPRSFEQRESQPVFRQRPNWDESRFDDHREDESDAFGIGGSRYDRTPGGGYSVPDRDPEPFGVRGEPNEFRESIPYRRERLAPPTRSIRRRPQSTSHDRPDPQALISRRYQDPTVLRFIGTLSPQRAVAMYTETLNLIESRHLSPPDPQELVERGVSNLLHALRNPDFIQANRLPALAHQGQQFDQALTSQLRQIPVRSTRDAATALETAMQIGSQYLRLSPSVVALEFEYGAMESLDRFSAFVPQESARATNQQLGEAVVGIGVQIEAAEEGLVILKVIEDSPAEQAGLQKGDVILTVDGQQLAGRDLSSASALIGGPEGSTVRLEVERQAGRTAQLTLPRRSVAVHSVTDVQMIDPSAGVGYLKLDTFAANSAEEMQQALWRLQQQGMQSLVLDLRGDPGGLLTTAVEVADLFLPQGTIVSTRGRHSSDDSTQTASREQTWKVPLVLLVDENSASASEILAAAIQENGRGVVVGRRTYGKGTVQTLFPLQSVDAGLRLTTAKFYSPTGREMAGAGVEPDVPVSDSQSGYQGDSRSDRALQMAVDVARTGNPPGYDVSQRSGTRGRRSGLRRSEGW